MEPVLNLADALKLAKLLLPYMPNDASKISVLDFSGKILDRIASAGKHREYLEMVSLMSHIDYEQLKRREVTDIFALFIGGLQENEILSLMEFYKGLSHG